MVIKQIHNYKKIGILLFTLKIYICISADIPQDFDGSGLASCGRDSVPYSITIDLNGHPELFCDSPSCFGLPKNYHRRKSNGNIVKPADDNVLDFATNRVDKIDNLLMQRLRRRRLYRRRMLRRAKRASSMPMNRFAECSGTFTNTVCAGSEEWTGGLAEFNNGTHISLQMECCRVDGFRGQAYELKSIMLRPGDHYTGGTFREHGKQVGFDVIKEIRKNVTQQNDVIYVVTIWRMNCSPSMRQRNNDKGRNRFKVRLNLDEMPKRPRQLMHTPMEGRRHIEPGMNHYPADYYQTRRELDIDRKRPAQAYFMDEHENKKIPSRRAEARIAQMYPRRRQYYRPAIVDEYDYYDDLEPVVPIYRRRQPANGVFQRRSRIRVGENELWPIGYKDSSKKPRLYNGGAYEPQDNQITYKPDEEYQVPVDTGISPSFSLTEHQTGYSNAPQHTEPTVNNYVTLIPNQINQGYATANTYAPYVAPFVPDPTAQPAAIAVYEQTNQQQQYVHQQPYQSYPVAASSDCDSQCTTYSTPCYAGVTTGCCCQQGAYGAGNSNGAAGGLNGMFSTLQCFSGDMTVQTPNGLKQMNELEIGEMVLTMEQNLIIYSPIVMFLHRKSEDTGNFRLLKTENGEFLKLTEFHLIYVSECKPKRRLKLKYARDVRVGQCVQVVASNTKTSTTKTTKIIEIEEEEGIYAPLTANGNIIVNGVLASCHSNMAIQALQQTFFAWWRNVRRCVDSFMDLLNPLKTILSFFMFKEYVTPVSTGSLYDGGEEIPFGVEYVISILDVFVPQKMFHS